MYLEGCKLNRTSKGHLFMNLWDKYMGSLCLFWIAWGVYRVSPSFILLEHYSLHCLSQGKNNCNLMGENPYILLD